MLHESVIAGLRLFVRYAHPPNLRGFCGPDDHATLLEYGLSGEADEGLLELARDFSGPLPYLRLIADHAGIEDPFDLRVVEAYWVGNDLLHGIVGGEFGRALDDAFRRRAGSQWDHLVDAIPAGAVPHHSFHVFGVYPWVGLLGDGDHGRPLEVLQQCRIRWGKVVAVSGDSVVVESEPLLWDGRRLYLGPPVTEQARLGWDGTAVLTNLKPGEWVSLHWDWVCDRLTPERLDDLRRLTRRQLAITNRTALAAGVVG